MPSNLLDIHKKIREELEMQANVLKAKSFKIFSIPNVANFIQFCLHLPFIEFRSISCKIHSNAN